jgi:hypothetical protein
MIAVSAAASDQPIGLKYNPMKTLITVASRTSQQVLLVNKRINSSTDRKSAQKVRFKHNIIALDFLTLCHHGCLYDSACDYQRLMMRNQKNSDKRYSPLSQVLQATESFWVLTDQKALPIAENADNTNRIQRQPMTRCK